MSDKVTVACKLPHGLILRVFDKQKVQEPMPGGGTKAVERAFPRPQTVTLKGYLDKYDPSIPPAARGSSYALTHDVDKDFFDLWLKQNHDLDAVTNHLVFAHDQDTLGMTEEYKATRSGLEPVNPRALKGRVQTADEQKKQFGIAAA
jgi:hypothetical protein